MSRFIIAAHNCFSGYNYTRHASTFLAQMLVTGMESRRIQVVFYGPIEWANNVAKILEIPENKIVMNSANTQAPRADEIGLIAGAADFKYSMSNLTESVVTKAFKDILAIYTR